jgi:hypothetical protein
MHDVAHAAGVSVSTVANVLSRPSIVAPETRRRVQEAMERVGYVPHGPARVLRGVPSAIVGSVLLDLANPFYAKVNRGIENRLAEADCLVLAGSADLEAGRVFTADPDRNIVFSIHMYSVYKTAAKVAGYLNAFRSTGLPLDVGEFGSSRAGVATDAILSEAQSRAPATGAHGEGGVRRVTHRLRCEGAGHA